MGFVARVVVAGLCAASCSMVLLCWSLRGNVAGWRLLVCSRVGEGEIWSRHGEVGGAVGLSAISFSFFQGILLNCCGCELLRL